MSGLVSGVEHLIGSIVEIFQGIIGAIVSAFQSVFALAKNLISSLLDLLSGLVGFVIGNIFIIGVVVAAFIGYQAYTGRRVGGRGGNTITGGKGKKRA